MLLKAARKLEGDFSLSRRTQDPSHGMVFLQTSEQLGWSNLQAAVIEKRPLERVIASVRCLFLAMPLVEADLTFITDGQKVHQRMAPGRMCIVAPGAPLRTRLANPARSLDVAIPSDLLSEVAGELFDCPDMEIVSKFGVENSGMASLLQAVMAALSEPAQHCSLAVEYLARALVAGVLERHGVRRRSHHVADTGSSLGSRQFRRVVEYIEEYLSSEISLNELASVAGLSRTNFIQRFKRSTHQTPHQYVMCARVRRGQELLAKSDLPIAHIAAICGFSDHAHFSSVFKRILGITPSAYKRACE